MSHHSASSSVLLASLLDEECTQPRVSDAYLQAEESDFARFLDDHLCTMVDPQAGPKALSLPDFHSIPASTIGPEAAEACSTDGEMRPQSYREQKSAAPLQQPPYCMATDGCDSSNIEVFGFRGPISEVLADESAEACRLNDDARTMKISRASHWPKPPKTPAIPQKGGGLAHVNGQITRCNSSPADVLSRLIMEEGESVLQIGDPSTSKSGKGQTVLQNHVCATYASSAKKISSFDQANCASNIEAGKGVLFVEAKSVKSPASDERKRGLLRQNSSPADISTQALFNGMSSLACTEITFSPFSAENTTEEGRREGADTQPANCWGKTGFDEVGLEDRKRERDDHSMQGLPSSEISFIHPAHVGRSYAELCGSKDLAKMEVLCRVSAKRGCATHPRSIAERVRRTKINEGMRKLQELMPGMEKQTNTVTMLDEAVEYVKFLQQQVQKLSESQSKCDGRCNPKTNA